MSARFFRAPTRVSPVHLRRGCASPYPWVTRRTTSSRTRTASRVSSSDEGSSCKRTEAYPHRSLSVISALSAHASTATATASLYFLSAWYCSALPPRWIRLQICLWPRRQWSCWQVLLQYLVWHLTQRGALWASGAAQAAQVVRIIFGLAGRLARSRGQFDNCFAC